MQPREWLAWVVIGLGAAWSGAPGSAWQVTNAAGCDGPSRCPSSQILRIFKTDGLSKAGQFGKLRDPP